VTIFSSICTGSRRLLLSGVPVFALLISTAIAQQTPVAPAVPQPTATGNEESLGAVARTSKKQTTSRARKVITEDDMDAAANILPRLRTEGAENSDEIIAAIGKYKETHTAAETEEVVQAWYERYDEDLAAAIQQNQVVNSLREENLSNGYEICRQGGEYQSCENRRRAEYTGARHDQATIINNGALEVRIQHVFMRVRSGIMRYNLRYDWFKIRTTNGIDLF
jgi:hypothetical protein